MQGTNTLAPKAPERTEVRCREQLGTDDESRDDATLSAAGDLDISEDEDRGSDPYNRTGRFERAVR